MKELYAQAFVTMMKADVSTNEQYVLDAIASEMRARVHEPPCDPLNLGAIFNGYSSNQFQQELSSRQHWIPGKGVDATRVVVANLEVLVLHLLLLEE